MPAGPAGPAGAPVPASRFHFAPGACAPVLVGARAGVGRSWHVWHLHVVLLGHALVLVGACVLCWCRNWHLMWCSWSRWQIGTCFLSSNLCRDVQKAVLYITVLPYRPTCSCVHKLVPCGQIQHGAGVNTKVSLLEADGDKALSTESPNMNRSIAYLTPRQGARQLER